MYGYVGEFGEGVGGVVWKGGDCGLFGFGMGWNGLGGAWCVMRGACCVLRAAWSMVDRV